MNRLILIDADEIRAQHLARRLRLRGLPCDVATSFLYALTTLEWQRPSLIVARAEAIDGMTPTEFATTIGHDPVSRAIPTVLVGSSDDAAHFDAVVNETDADRLASAIARLARDGIATTTPQAPDRADVPDVAPSWLASGPVRRSFGETPLDQPSAGQLTVGHLEGFLAMLDDLSLALKTGRIVVRSTSPSQPAFVLLDHGQMVHASFGRLEGAPAFRRVITSVIHQPDLTYQFEPLERWQMGSYPRSIRRHERQRLLQLAEGQEWGTQELVIPHEFAAREG